MKHLLLILLSFFVLIGCVEKRQSKAKIHTYQTTDSETDDLLFWYIIFTNNGGCYYYSSPTPVTNFAAIDWEESDSLPTTLEGVSEIESIQVSVEEIAQEVTAEIDANEISDMEAVEQASAEIDAGDTGDNGIDASGDVSSDVGSSDSGGGDSGGGGE